ncbi:hypothetical protein [Marispirochaeta aestuarii]|uniref:hypothetical protein n=1 Tax=Marispirochaeta aestuarii TaxID=1963862 RepID=UPI0029C88E78|nr:hypothetical protein [Marispirochaeta aestuarii]
MPRDPKLTNVIKNSLIPLEENLKACVRSANLQEAKRITADIQNLLREKGYNSRLCQNKLILFEVALEANSIEWALSGLYGIKNKVSSSSRLYLETIVLMTLCYIRKGDFDNARKYTSLSLKKINNIKSDVRRRKFQKVFTERVEDEIALFSIKSNDAHITVEKVHEESIKLIQSKTEDEIIDIIGNVIPSSSVQQLSHYQEFTLSLIPPPDREALPKPIKQEERKEVGRKFSGAIKRVVWKSLCDQSSDIYKAWSEGLSIVHDKKWIATAVVAAFSKFSIAIPMLAASVVALAIRFGVGLFCETFKPDDIMELRR